MDKPIAFKPKLGDSWIPQSLKALGLQLWEPGFESKLQRATLWVWVPPRNPTSYRSNKPQPSTKVRKIGWPEQKNLISLHHQTLWHMLCSLCYPIIPNNQALWYSLVLVTVSRIWDCTSPFWRRVTTLRFAVTPSLVSVIWCFDSLTRLSHGHPTYTLGMYIYLHL